MKFAVTILAVLAVASPLTAYKLPAAGSGALAKELQDLVDLIPFGKMAHLFKAYASQDKEVQVALKVLQSNELKLFVRDVEANPEIKILLKHIQEAGLDIITLINKLNDILDLDHISPLEASAELKNLQKYILGKIILKNRLNDILDKEDKELGGIVGLESDMWDLVPQAKLEKLVKEKFANSTVFEKFLRGIFNDEIINVYLSFRTSEHWVKLIQEAEQADIYSEFFTDYFPVLMAAKIILAVAV